MRLHRGQDYIEKTERRAFESSGFFVEFCQILSCLPALLITIILGWPTAKKSTQGIKPVLVLWFKASYIWTGRAWSTLTNFLTSPQIPLHKDKPRRAWLLEHIPGKESECAAGGRGRAAASGCFLLHPYPPIYSRWSITWNHMLLVLTKAHLVMAFYPFIFMLVKLR